MNRRMSGVVRCPDCQKLVSSSFPIHDCTPKINKSEIVHDISYALVRFGKNDWVGTRRYLEQALEKLEHYLTRNSLEDKK